MRNLGTTGDLEGVVRPNGQEKAYKTGRAKAKPWLTVVKRRQRNWLKCERAKAKPWLTEEKKDTRKREKRMRTNGDDKNGGRRREMKTTTNGHSPEIEGVPIIF